MVNMTTPASVVTNDQVKRISANGCSIMKMPAAMTTQAKLSIGPRRSAFGQVERVEDCTCAPPRK